MARKGPGRGAGKAFGTGHGQAEPAGQRMSQIDEHERRLAAALARIGAAAERLAEAPPDGAAAEAPDSAAEVEAARLARLLEEARAETAEVQRRMDTARDRQAATVATLEARIAALTQQIDSQGIEVQRLRMLNVQLREALRALRESLAAGVAEPAQINRALQAEVEALRTARAIEVAELDTLLAALEPHVTAAEARADAPADPDPAPEDPDARA